MQDYQREFLDFALDVGVLRFGEFTLKSGRISPYFFNAGGFDDGASLAGLGSCYADAIADSGVSFDMLFGTAALVLAVLVLFGVNSLLAILWNVITVSLRQTIIPDALLGRVNGLFTYVAAAVLGEQPVVDRWTFSTNGVAIMGLHGIPCIGFGPGNEVLAHAPDEKVPVDHLVRASAFYTLFALRFAQQA